MIIPGTEAPVRDLTRWNRSGLDRFRYVDGGAAEWVEYLRICHLLLTARPDVVGISLTDDPEVWREAYRTGVMPDGTAVATAAGRLGSAWQRLAFDGAAPETATHRQILRAQYDHIGLDQTRQISRAFARALHILTETLNAYANEGTLATASQTAHLRRLLEMIDFAPVPAASALVPIALTLADDAVAAPVGLDLAFEHTPADGSPILTFEALETVTGHPRLNLLRAAGWDTRSDPLKSEQTVLPVASESVFSNVLIGTTGLIEDDGGLEAIYVEAASKAAATLTVERGAERLACATYQTATLHLAPTFKLAARPRGDTWLNFATVPKAYVGQTLALQSFEASGEPRDAKIERLGPRRVVRWFTSSARGIEVTKYAQVMEVRGRDVRVDVTPGAVQAVYPAVQSVIVLVPAEGPDEQDVLGFGPYVVPEGAAPIGEFEPLASDRVHFDGTPPETLKEGDLAAVLESDGARRGTTIASLEPEDGGYSLALEGIADPSRVTLLFTGFKATTGLIHDERSPAALFDAQGRLVLSVEPEVRPLLGPGRRIIVAADREVVASGAPAAGFTIATASADDAGNWAITVNEDRSLLAGLTRGRAVIYGNVLQFGEGKSLPAKVLGSGDNAVAGQSMVVTDVPVATRPDPTYRGGVALDIEITVAGRVWRQVAAAEDATDDEPTYVVEVGDDGLPVVTFLQRLPSGADNVMLTRIRKGAGAGGNAVPPYAVKKPKTDVAPVTALVQPVGPQFGADLQDAEALRNQGGSHFALADRVLSTSDFATFAESYTGVWHASAALRRIAGTGGRPTVVLTIVPAGGGAIGAVATGLRTYLLDRALPDTQLLIEPYVPAPFGGSLTLNLKKGYAHDQSLIDGVKAAMMARFGLAHRGLGQRFFVTEIVAAVEAIAAVQNLVFTLTPLWPSGPGAPRLVTSAGAAIQAVLPDIRTTVFLEKAEDIAISFGTGAA